MSALRASASSPAIAPESPQYRRRTGYHRRWRDGDNGLQPPWAFDLTAYLAERSIRWFADWRHFATDLLGEGLESKGWRLVDRECSMELYRRD